MAAHDITPWVTMFHWDLPQALEDNGGWRVRATVDAFAHYADTIVRAYGDRVRHWITVNEIVCFTRLGHGGGRKAPGTRESEQVINQTYHHALLCHGHGVRAVREHGRRDSRVGIADNPVVPVPCTETAADIAAARAAFITENVRVLEPLFRGRHTAAYRQVTGRNAARTERSDWPLICLPADFLGLNLYTGVFVRAGLHGRIERLPFPAGYPRADLSWLQLVPQALYWGPRFAREIYGAGSIVITENGAGYTEPASCSGPLPDLHRREYVRQCLGELHRAIQAGAPVAGYFLWSFLDNYEWEDGYGQRFGLVHVNYRTQRRTPKLSAAWYTAVMRNNRVV
jgi:beta-glucosidase